MKNIFLALEEYIINPTPALEEEIKEISHSLTRDAIQKAMLAFPNKAIGADEYQPILLAKMSELAVEAFEKSPGRFIQNDGQITQADPKYIFRLTKDQQQLIFNLKGTMLPDSKKRRPDGLIFAYAGYVERRKVDDEFSRYNYCSSVEGCIRDQNMRLLKTANSFSSPVKEELLKVYNEINTHVNEGVNSQITDVDLKDQVKGVLQMVEDKFKEIEYSDVKLVIKNFLYALSIVGLLYLHKTSDTRGSFWLNENLKDATIIPFEEKLSAAPGA